MDVLRERIAQAIWEKSGGLPEWDALRLLTEGTATREHHLELADAVIAELGLVEDTERRRVAKWTDGRRWDDAYEARRYVTPWERIEEDT